MPRRARRRRLSQGNLNGEPAADQPQTPAKGDPSNRPEFVDLGTNDDEAERQQARRVRRKSIGAVTPRSARRRSSRKSPYFSGRRSNRRPKRLDESALSAIYTQAIHLSQHGKINAKNAWNLELTEHIDDVIRLDPARRETTDFQRASHTIDAASKIYGVRVDAVHTATYKMMGSMNVQQGDDGGMDDPANDGMRRNRRRDVGKKTLTSGEAIAENAKNLIESVDALFHKTASAFDEGGARGLLMNQLYVQNGCEILFDSETKLGSATDDAPLSVVEEDAEARRDQEWIDHLAATILSETVVDQLPENALSQYPPDVGDGAHGEIDLAWIQTTDICPLLGEFDRGIKELLHDRRDEKDQDGDIELSPPERGPEDDNISEMNFGMLSFNDAPDIAPDGFGDGAERGFSSMDAGDLYDGVPFDDNMPPPPPGGIDDVIEAGRLEQQMVSQLANDEIDLETHEFRVAGQRQSLTGRRDVVGTLSSSLNIMNEMMQTVDVTDVENMTTFFDPKKHGNWAGPDHWHYRRTQLEQAKKNGNGQDGDLEESAAIGGNRQEKRKRKSKKQMIDFVSIGNGNFLDDDLFAAPPRSNNCLSAAVLKKHQEDFHLLPEDHQLTPRMFMKMFLKPKYSVFDHWKLWTIRQKQIHISHVMGDDVNVGPDMMDDGVSVQGLPGGIDDGDDDGVRDGFYDYSNANDMMNFVPQSHPIECLVDNDDMMNDPDDALFGGMMFSFGDKSFHVVAEPKRTVEEIEINFAVKSKKVDVRKLKHVMWQDISRRKQEASANNDENANPNEDEKEEDGEKERDVTFQQTIQSATSQIDGRQVDQLSVSFCFMCLLHLANEKNLVLETDRANLGDFAVRFDECGNLETSVDSAFRVEG